MQHPSSTHRSRWAAGRSGATGILGAIALLLVVLGLPADAVTGTSASMAPREEPEAFEVELASISPSTLSDEDRPLTITGTVTNQSDEPWTEINLYSFRSASPIIDAQTLAASAGTDVRAFVGERIVTTGTEDTVDELDPGESADFSLTVPRSEIAVTAQGVYWLGVHASGVDSAGQRDTFADGRARTFIPLVPRTRGEDRKTVEAAVVVPVRETVWFEPDGQLGRLPRWRRTLEDGGRLDSILEAGEASSVPLTWLVDPAVLVAIERLAAGNPPRSLAPDPTAPPPSEDPGDDEPQEDSGDGSDGSGDGAPPDADGFMAPADPLPPIDPDRELSEREQVLADSASAWMARFTALTAGQTVLALPYGDLDVSAATEHAPTLYPQAASRSLQVMDWLGIAATPALAPRDGILSPAAISAAGTDTTILIGDTSFSVPPDSPSSVVRLLGHKVVVTSTGAAAGGPSPTAADDPLALRQRLLSEAALRLTSPSPSPVVTMLPADWHPDDPGALLGDLDVRWLSPVTVAQLAVRPAVAMSARDLAYTTEDQAVELPSASFSAADQLTARADLLAGLLTLPNLVRRQVADEVLVSLSIGHRPHPDEAADSVQAATGFINDQLADVAVDASDAVTLSSASGQFGADLVNGLDQPVTVRVAARSGGDLELEDLGVQQLGPNSKKRILPSVSTSRPGIHQVSLLITDEDGEPTGGSADLQIRAAQVSGLIWLMLGGGALLLFGTIAVRLLKRLRARRRGTDGATAVEAAT